VSRQQSLGAECLAAFQNYAREARKTCQLLGEAELTAPSGEQLLAILSQARIESDVRELYASLRQRLCKALASGVEVSGTELETPFLEIDADQRIRRN
jgi:orotidine-5'-phosphate decarboxylase